MYITSLGFLVMVLLSFLSSTFAGDLVQWTDENGTLHFSDSMDTVPAKYRRQAKLEKFKEEKVPQRSRSEGPRADSDRRIPGSQGEKPTLNSYEVPFEAYEGSAQRVIVSVTFNNSVTVPMIIDTGAPGLLISSTLAKKLGVYENDEGKVATKAGGIGGSVSAVRTFIDRVQVGGAKDSFIPATITPSMSPAWEGLIGMDFMSKYSFKIDSAKQVVVFEEIASNPNSPGGHNEKWWRGLFKEFHSLGAAWKNVSQRARSQQEYQFAIRQTIEADKLLNKLDRHASEHSVPQTWR
ncbi:MAG TPA: aspartyl protease family protein [Nitrospiraceae bacterium]